MTTTHTAGETVTLCYAWQEDGKTIKAYPKAKFTGKEFDIAGETFYLYIHLKSQYQAYLSLDDLAAMQPKQVGTVASITYGEED